MSHSSGPFRLAGAGAVALAAAAASITQADPDLWGHVRFGADTVSRWSLTAVDPYSFTQDRPWINHEWLSEVMMGWAWTHGQTLGLLTLKALLTLCAIGIVWFALRRVSFPVRLAIMAIVVVGTAPITRTLRPQLWSLLFLAATSRLLLSPRRTVRWWIPPMFALWANSHGGWIVGYSVLAVWILAELAGRRAKPLSSALLLGTSLCATLVTPDGWRLWQFLFETVRPFRPMIEEWQPLSAFPLYWIPFLAAAGGAVWALWRPHPQRWPAVAAVTMLAIASFRTARVYPLFVAAAAVLLSPMIEARAPRVSRSRAGATAGEWAVAIVVAGLLAPAGLWAAATRCVDRDSLRMPDHEAVRLLADAPAGRLVTYFNWGEYAIWHLGPRLLVSMDGRRETVYSDRRLAEHDAILAGTAEGLGLLAEWRPEYVWLPASSASTRTWLEQAGYHIALSTAKAFVAVRGDIPPWPVKAPSAPGLARCFPD